MNGNKCGLLILDGAGLAPPSSGNVVDRKFMPTLFGLFDQFGMVPLKASGEAVGLFEGDAGNSEVGHLTLGLGRCETAAIVRIDRAFNDGSWGQSPVWELIKARRDGSRPLHVIGLLSDAGVHGHWRTMVRAAQLAERKGESDIVVHPVLDGVDSRPGSAEALFRQLTLELAQCAPLARIGVVIGRKWFADRSGNLALTEFLMDALRRPDHLPKFSPEMLKALFGEGGEHECLPHALGSRVAIDHGDRVLVTSHRADRTAQTVEMLSNRGPVFTLVTVSDSVPGSHVFFPTREVVGGVAEKLNSIGIPIVRIAEKCKFPHVTYFFNGFRKHMGEEQICLPDTIGGPAANPAMRARETADACRATMSVSTNRSFVANIPNLDQVGHCADVPLGQSAAVATDEALSEIVQGARRLGWTLLVTADHGNAETLVDDQGRPFGSHTTNAVPFSIITPDGSRARYAALEGTLQNVAPTLCELLGASEPNLGPAKSLISTGGVGR